jgi:hypothetical protein
MTRKVFKDKKSYHFGGKRSGKPLSLSVRFETQFQRE